MLGNPKTREICEATHHEWKEEYYGYKCENCGEFIPYGSEPWEPDEEEGYRGPDIDRYNPFGFSPVVSEIRL
jgi:hypothetical protein